MSKILSLFGFGDKDSSRPGSLDAARDIIARASDCGPDEGIALLRKALKRHPDLAGAFVWLHVHERRHTDDNGAMTLVALLVEDQEFSPAQRRRSAAVAGDELDKALRDKDITDDVKITLLPLLMLVGRPVDDDSVKEFFLDYEAAAQRNSVAFAQSISDSPLPLTKLLLVTGFASNVEDILEDHVPRDLASQLLTMGHAVSGINPDSASTLMTAALVFRVGASDFSHEHSPEQLDGIHAMATPRARWCLETLANWPGFAMPFREKARRLAAELASRGIKCQAPLTPGEFSHGIISMIDGMGSRTATLFHRTPEGGFDAFNMMLNDEVGVKDAYAYFGNGSELEELLRHNPEQMQVANAMLPLIRGLLADSFALHEDLRTAPPGRLFPLMAYLGDEPIKPQKREPNLGAYMLETMRPTRELVVSAVDLTENPLYGSLFPTSDAAYVFCEKHMDKKRQTLDIDKIPLFVQEIMPSERERLMYRLAVNLEVEALAGRAGRKDNQAAARLWLGMKENVMPFLAIPFVQELAGMAASRITADLRRGFKNRRSSADAENLEAEIRDNALADFMESLELERAPKAKQEAVFTDLMNHLFGKTEFPCFPQAKGLNAVSNRKRKPRGKTKPKEKAAKRAWAYVGPPEEKVKSSSSQKTGRARKRNIYRLAVDLIDYPPMVDDFMGANTGIFREIEVAGDQTLEKLHLAIFKAFDREEMHGYEFQLSDKRMDPAAPRYTHPQIMTGDSDGNLVHDATVTTLDELGLVIGQRFLYWFDFGDDWWHGITVKGIGPHSLHRRYPRVMAKHGVSPPQYLEE